MIYDNKNKIVVILGPTASGKTRLGVQLAKKLNGEIISADSRQVYRDMDIGTGKDLNEYKVSALGGSASGGESRKLKVEKKEKFIKIPYHLIDVCDPKKRFSLADYQRLADKAIIDILERGKLPIVVGGSGLYLQAIVDGYQLTTTKPDLKLRRELTSKSLQQLTQIFKKLDKQKWQSMNISDQKNPRRLIRYIEIAKAGKYDNKIKSKPVPKYEFLILGLNPTKESLHKKIYQRIIQRLDNEDMVGEVKRLHKQGLSWKRLEEFGLEYKYISLYLQNKISYEEMIDKLFQETKRFVKRQMTWFRRWERQGRSIYWTKSEKEINYLIREFKRKIPA